MFKFFILIFIFIKLFLINVLAEDKYEIILKIDEDIITNYDLKNETKYLLALNPPLQSLSEEQIKKFSRESLIRETIKENTILRHYEVNYDDPSLIGLTKNLYYKINVNNESEFNNYLSKFDLDLKQITRKLAIESAWNKLIFEKYKNLVNIDQKKIRNNLENKLNDTKKQKSFLISEILFDAKNREELKKKYKEIVTTIKEKNFRTAASIYSISATAKDGGEIGWINKGSLSNIIFGELSKLKINEFTQPIKIASGFLVVYLADTREEEIKFDLEEEIKKITLLENDRQLNQYSIIYYKKIEKEAYISEE